MKRVRRHYLVGAFLFLAFTAFPTGTLASATGPVVLLKSIASNAAGVMPDKLPGSCPFVGLYVGLQFQANVLGGGGGSLKNVSFLATQDGRFFNGRLEVDPARFDWDAAIRERPNAVGRYSVSGNKIRLAYVNGKTYEYDLVNVRGDHHMQFRGIGFERVPALKVERLVGTYRTSSSTQVGSSSSANRSSVSHSNTFHFAADGRFTEERFGSVNGVFENRTLNTQSTTSSYSQTKPVGGRYRIHGYTITLEYDDGQKFDKLCYVFSDKDAATEHPDVVIIGGVSFTNTQKK